jgi:predicted nucleic acid-binding protein
VIVVDASVWVAWLTSTDAHHTASREWLSACFRGSKLLAIPQFAVVEVVGAIARRSGSPELAKKAATLVLKCPGLQLYHLDDAQFDTALRLPSTKRLSGADALYVALAQMLRVPLVSWDTEHLERAGGLIECFRPTVDG